MKNKKIKNKGLENWLIRKSPFKKKTTQFLIVLISVLNFVLSGLLFTETISNIEKSQQLAQFFQERSQNTTGR